ncbi:Ser-Thr-rich glycosyl-phosphatidyl-inositol-anchored membrane family domain-containing protein [Trichoderma barbatum]
MRFTLTASAFLALVSSAFAQTADFDPVFVPTDNQIIPAGAPFTVQWDAPAKYAAGTVTIELIGGATQATQQVLGTIATGIKNSQKSYTWNVDASLGTQAFYGLIIRLESNPSVFQYSNPFHIKAGSVHSSTPAGPVKSSSPAGPAHTSGSYGQVPPVQSGSYGELPADTTTVTTASGTKTVTISEAPVTTSAPYTPPVYSPPAVTDVTVIRNATTTVPCTNSTIALPSLSTPAGNPTTLQSATRLPPPPPSSPVYVPPGQAQTSTVWAGPSAPSGGPVVTALPPLPTNAGARVGGSSLALVASLVVAYFAL